ncbi:MAG: transcriptional regulator [Thermoplasmata archaeon]|nr:transcriptional regulator [Thermoplasmata archaeon]
MSDVGYSSEYEVYLTRENGVQIVTNSLSLAILKEMRIREISPTEIATTLGVSKSTIQGNMAKLLRTGIVTQEARVNDARIAVYRTDAILMFCSDTDVEWQLYARSASIARIMRNGQCTCREDLSLYTASLTESGLNVIQGLFNVGAALTYIEGGRRWWDHILDDIQGQCAPYGISVHMETLEDLTLVFTSKKDDISDLPLIVVPMIGAFISHSRMLLGFNLAHDLSLKVSEHGRRVDIHVPAFYGQEFDAPRPIMPNSDAFKVKEPFSIYSIGGKATLFTNPTMMSILDNLSNGNYSLNELEDIMGISKATLYASLVKLQDMGAVEIEKDSGSPKKYKLTADPILYVTEPGTKNRDILNGIAERFQSGEVDYYSSVIAYAMEVIDCLGIHFDKMFIRAGRNAANTVIDQNPGIEPQQFVDLACNMVSPPDRAELRTYLPLRIEVTLSKNTLWVSWPGDFIMGFINEGLKRLLGEKYRVKVEVIREGASDPLMVLNN